MVCYAVPAVAAIVHYGLRKSNTSWKKSTSQLWLGLLLAGGAIFGIVDHLWNGELFLFGENLILDLLLGVTITVAIVISWFIVITLNKTSLEKPKKQLN
jgi:hypothetical protein